MDESVRVNVIPTLTDYFWLSLRVSIRRLRWVIPLAVLLLVLYLIAPFLVAKEEKANWFEVYVRAWPSLIVPVGLFVFMPVAIYFGVRKRWQTANEWNEPRTYIFSDEGVQVVASTFEGKMAWVNIVRAERTGSLIYLATAQQAFYLIPVRAFDSELDMEKFFNLVENKVPNNRLV